MIPAIVAALSPIVKKFEGLHRLVRGLVYPYICPAGYPTQGYGVLVLDMKAPPITVEQAEQKLDTILPGYILETFKLCPRLWLEPPEVGAAISDFTFNLGATRLRGSTLRKRVNEGDWDAVCEELAKWKFGGGRALPGLVARRAHEIALIKEAQRNHREKS